MFPSANLMGDTHIFDSNVSSGLDWLDTNGSSTLTSANLGDLGVYNGTKFVKKPFNLAGVTPRRVSTLPSESSSLEGEQCYLTANYTKDNGINITPQLFAGTELDSVTNSDAPSATLERRVGIVKLMQVLHLVR